MPTPARLLPLALLLAACGDDVTPAAADAAVADSAAPTADAAPTPDGAPPKPTLAWCVAAHAFIPAPAGEWTSSGSSLVAALGAPGHSLRDVIVADGSAVVLDGKFAYGTISKDLQGEAILVYLDDCGGWELLGAATSDSDGRIAFTVDRTLGYGVYDVRLEVVGDASLARGTIWVLPAGTHFMVADLDGTMTTGDTELWVQLFDGSYVPEAYPSAVALSLAERALGRVPLYLTGRPYWVSGVTRDWLDDLGFAAAPLHTTSSNTESLPTDGNVGAYKRDFLLGLVAAGFVIDDAYGNATTDIYAYAGAGVPPTATWIIGSHGGEGGTVAVADSWAARTAEVAASPAVVQPFIW